jgi:hypothetical protein
LSVGRRNQRRRAAVLTLAPVLLASFVAPPHRVVPRPPALNWVGVASTTLREAGGALLMTSTGPSWAGAETGASVGTWIRGRPGKVYVARADLRAVRAGEPVFPALTFFDRWGRELDHTVGQPTRTSGSWRATFPVAGIAPAGTAYVSFRLAWYAQPGQVQEMSHASVRSFAGTPAVAGPLRTRGTRILDAHGHAVRLRGLMITGLEGPDNRYIPTDEIIAAKRWGANIIRVPLGEQLWLRDSCQYDPTYVNKVDAAVHEITRLGMVALLDLHFTTLRFCGRPAMYPMPDYPRAISFWRQVAARYKRNRLVAFELFNEPHDIPAAVWRNGGLVRTRHGSRFRAVGMQQLYDAVRSTGARNLVFVGGEAWSFQWSGRAPIRGFNIVYVVHLYKCLGNTPPACRVPRPYSAQPNLAEFRHHAQRYHVPVVVTEFGWPAKNDGRFVGNVIRTADSYGWGWIVFAWDGTTDGRFDLVRDTPADGYWEPDATAMPAVIGFHG